MDPRDVTLARNLVRYSLSVQPGEVDPGYLSQLLTYEDRRFHDHGGVDLRAGWRPQTNRCGSVPARWR